MRATGGVFVWAIESVLLALFGVGTISIMHMVGGTSSVATDMWAISVALCSCVLNLVLQTFVACSSKQPTIIEIPEGGNAQFAMMYMHKAVAQGHCSVMTLVLTMYIITMQRSLTDLDWANAYYASAPGLVWITGTITLGFLTVLWFTSITGAWAATAVGDSNTLFCIIPTTAIVCITFPILNEIGSNGLMVCSNPMSSTLAVLYANLALATSFTISLLDCVEFDPARILPRFMRTVGDRMPSFRIYNMLHGVCISITVVMYWISTTGITPIVFLLLSANGIVTVANSLTVGPVWSPVNSIFKGIMGGDSAVDSDGNVPDSDDDVDAHGNEDEQPTVPFESQFDPVSFAKNRTMEETRTHIHGPQKRTRLVHPRSNQAQKHTSWAGLGFLHRTEIAKPPTTPTAMSITERRIALLRLDSHSNANLHEM